MTALSMHQASIPAFLRSLGALRRWLEKAEAHAVERGFDPDVLVAARLYPDMYALAAQVQRATDTAKFAAARLAGVDSPAFADDETTLAQLRTRLDRAIDYLGTFTAAQLDGSDAREVRVPSRGSGERVFGGRDYLLTFALPNFYFHVSMAYAILRHGGVPLGKPDFLALG